MKPTEESPTQLGYWRSPVSATLCVCFALFVFYRKEREKDAKKRKGIQVDSAISGRFELHDVEGA